MKHRPIGRDGGGGGGGGGESQKDPSDGIVKIQNDTKLTWWW